MMNKIEYAMIYYFLKTQKVLFQFSTFDLKIGFYSYFNASAGSVKADLVD